LTSVWPTRAPVMLSHGLTAQDAVIERLGDPVLGLDAELLEVLEGLLLELGHDVLVHGAEGHGHLPGGEILLDEGGDVVIAGHLGLDCGAEGILELGHQPGVDALGLLEGPLGAADVAVLVGLDLGGQGNDLFLQVLDGREDVLVRRGQFAVQEGVDFVQVLLYSDHLGCFSLPGL